jgi:hypothetical protein
LLVTAAACCWLLLHAQMLKKHLEFGVHLLLDLSMLVLHLLPQAVHVGLGNGRVLLQPLLKPLFQILRLRSLFCMELKQLSDLVAKHAAERMQLMVPNRPRTSVRGRR